MTVVKRTIKISIVALVTILVMLLSILVIDNITTQIGEYTQLNYDINSEYDAMTIGSFEEILKEINDENIAFSFSDSDFEYKEKVITAQYINEYYFKINDNLLYGKDFTTENIENKDKLVIIGSTLARELFLNSNAVGKTITVNSEKYKISGIYSDEENIINDYSKNGRSYMFFPYTNKIEYEKNYIDMIIYNNNSKSSILLEQMTLDDTYYKVDFSDKTKVINDFLVIINLIIYIGVVIIVLKIRKTANKRLLKSIKKSRENNYILEGIKSEPIKYIGYIFSLIIVPVALVGAFIIIDFNIFIPSEYIPNDNIFDIAQYIERITYFQNEYNKTLLLGDIFTINLYKNSFNLLVYLITIFMITYILLTKLIINLINYLREKKR